MSKPGALLVAALTATGLLTACGTLQGASTPGPGLTALPARVTRDEAIAYIRGRGDEVERVDRVDARLVTLEEYLHLAGPIHPIPGDPHATRDTTGVTGFVGDPSKRIFWVVAMSGVLWPSGHVPVYFGGPPPVPSPTPYPPYRWGMALIEATRTPVGGGFVDAGIGEDWPLAFDRLPNHPATAYVPPTATSAAAPLTVVKLGPEAMSEAMRLAVGARIDRIEYKLMTLEEFTRGSGLDAHAARPAASPVWVVALAGDLPFIKKSPTDPVRARSILYLVDAGTTRSDSVIAAWSDGANTWPASFDALPDHPAVASSVPPTRAP